MAASWRSANEWRAENLVLTTGSDLACKLFDASLTQLTGWYDDSSVGGLEKTLNDCVLEDPNFVMGHVIKIGADLLGTGHTTRLDPKFQEEINSLIKLSNTQSVTERERRHVQAIKLLADGYPKDSAEIWEDILLDHPTDMLALKFGTDNYFFLGEKEYIRDVVASVIPLWKTSTPLYSYLHGMHAFGLEETYLFRQAEVAAKKGLEMNSKDAWATHALAHVYEMEGRTLEGISFLSSTLTNWESRNFLACHNFWHWGLYHIERQEYDAGLDIFKTQLRSRAKSGMLLDIVDCASLLWRLKMEGLDVKDLCSEVLESSTSHFEDHILLFNDVHFLMACLVSGDKSAAQVLRKSLEDFKENGRGENWKVSNQLGSSLFEALIAMDEGRHDDVVSTLYPLRNDLSVIGGSHAQRDLFNITLISAAVKSHNPKNQALARKLLMVRESLRGQCTLAQRMNVNLQPFLQA